MVIDLSMQFMIPFLFILAIIFGVFELASPIKNRAANLIIALVVSFFAASYGPFTTVLWSYLPGVTWFFIVMFFIVFSMEVFGLRGKQAVEPDKIVLSGAVLFILLSVGWMLVDTYSIEFPIIGGGENLILLFGLIFILMIFWSAFKIGSGGGGQPQEKVNT